MRQGQARPHYERLLQRFTELKKDEFDRKRDLAALTLLRQGVTFTVYCDAQGTEKFFPSTWFHELSPPGMGNIERGLEQRITALNLFCRTSTTADDSEGKESFPTRLSGSGQCSAASCCT